MLTLLFLSLQVDFFSPTPVKLGEEGVLIVRYPDGRASGDAFALFEEESHLEKALKMDRSNLGSRYVELYKSSVKEFRLVGVLYEREREREREREIVSVCASE